MGRDGIFKANAAKKQALENLLKQTQTCLNQNQTEAIKLQR